MRKRDGCSGCTGEGQLIRVAVKELSSKEAMNKLRSQSIVGVARRGESGESVLERGPACSKV